MHEYIVIGGGIIGLATSMAVGNKYLKARILVLEKEQKSIDFDGRRELTGFASASRTGVDSQSPRHDDPVVAQDVRCCARHFVRVCLMRTGGDHP
jgi:thioredoxin reductase